MSYDPDYTYEDFQKNKDEIIEKMIKGQLMAVGVRNDSVINRMRDIHRDNFLSQEFKRIAYTAKEIPLNKKHSRFMLEPMVTGKLFQVALLDGSQNVLVIADGSGYFSYLISSSAKNVTLVEDEEFLEFSRNNILSQAESDGIEVKNIEFIKVNEPTKGCEEKKPFDVIFICGTVEDVPDNLFSQLSSEGYVLTFTKRGYISDCVKFFKDENGTIHRDKLFECSVGMLKEFELKPSFKL